MKQYIEHPKIDPPIQKETFAFIQNIITGPVSRFRSHKSWNKMTAGGNACEGYNLCMRALILQRAVNRVQLDICIVCSLAK
jgi:hypothetical protein